jgi:predicted MPP superfamily phosphohydrolase
MKPFNFAIFLAVFFTVYGLANYYIFIRGWQALPRESSWRNAYLVVFLVIALAFVAGRFLERAWPSLLSDVLVWMGSFWIGAMLYFFLAVVLLDVLRLLHHFVSFYPNWITGDYENTKQWLALFTSGAIVLILAAGHINTLLPQVRTLAFAIPKKADGIQSLTIVAASDIHLGTIVGRRRFDGIVERINAFDADLVLLPGDIVDEDLGPVIRENLGESLRSIRSKYGVLAITGNHEYIGGAQAACDYLAAHGVKVLRDEVFRLDCGVFVVGREDRSITQFAGKKRKALDVLMAEVDRKRPVILLDHQPFHLEEAASNGVDLQLSGHTHHGQLWPINYITGAIYEVSRGYRQIGQTHVYVSSGVGTWGPPVRTTSRPEIVHITLTFENR